MTSKHTMDMHAGVKIPECDVCGEEFTDRRTLKTRIDMHAGVENHCCSVWGKRFTVIFVGNDLHKIIASRGT